MPKSRDSKRGRRRRSKFFWLDTELYFVSDRDDEQLLAVRVVGADRERIIQMMADNDEEMASALLERSR